MMPFPSVLTHQPRWRLLFILLFLALTGPAVAQVDGARPNFILMMADDMGWGDAGFNGGKIIQTPHLDAMARAGLTFKRFYAQSPVCSPTRGSCLTGRHPYRYGIYFANNGHLRKPERSLAEQLKASGYNTGHFGKWHLGTLTRETKDGRRGGRPNQLAHYAPPWEHGFDVAFSAEVQMPTWNPMRNQRFPSKFWTGPETYATENLDGDDSRVIMDRAIDFIQSAARRNQPFFAVIWFHTPHEPVVGGPEYLKRYQDHPEPARHYYACITAMDDQVGRVRKTLRQLEVAQNTLVFFCSDNGPEGDRQKGRTMGSAGPFRGRKRSLFEGGIRVPGLAEWPGVIKAGTVTDYPAVTSDYFPTLLESAGLQVPNDRPLDGISLVPVWTRNLEERPKPIGFQTRGGRKSNASRKSPARALIGNRFKLLTDLDDQGRGDMLFDLGKDPGESRNLAQENPDQLARMKKTLVEWIESCRASDQGKDYAKP